jgi:hypothetical protein
LTRQDGKPYHLHHFEAVKIISESLGKLTYIHGHVHANRTYRYSIEGLPGVSIVTPKAEDCSEGMGFNHDYLETDTFSGRMSVKELATGNIKDFAPLPEEYLNSDHWNKFVKPE